VQVRQFRAEPKRDGWRAVLAGGRLWSRRGTDLTRYFSGVVVAAQVSGAPGIVLDGELVCWDAAAGRTDFSALGRRLASGGCVVSGSGLPVPRGRSF
jgi:ATP-dependent DNA ligase